MKIKKRHLLISAEEGKPMECTGVCTLENGTEVDMHIGDITHILWFTLFSLVIPQKPQHQSSGISPVDLSEIKKFGR